MAKITRLSDNLIEASNILKYVAPEFEGMMNLSQKLDQLNNNMNT